MTASPSEKFLRSAFKAWALRMVLAANDHPLSFLVDRREGKWHPNMIRSMEHPSVDAGHLVSKWTGGGQHLALEETDNNRVFNKGEGPRVGVSFEKSAVLIGGIPVEYGTARMFEKLGLLKPEVFARARATPGALYTGGGSFSV